MGPRPQSARCGLLALLATSTGLWIGSDTDYIGDRTYLRRKVAFFPLAGGRTPPKDVTPNLPGRVTWQGPRQRGAADPDRLAFREFNGTTVGSEVPLTTGIPWGSVHGAFTVGGRVFYGESDGNLYERSFDGSALGTQTELDPYDDPRWDNVQTGSGQTYQGQPSTFLSEIPSVTSMFFSAGRLFYTMAGDHGLHWRWFEPQSGIVGSDEFAVTGGPNLAQVAGAFLAGTRLYYADQTNGELWSVGWSGEAPTGTPRLVDRSTDWASQGLFLLSQTAAPTPTPKAAFTVRCGNRASCRFKASQWVDPDGGVVKYAWRFGDGTTKSPTTSATASHRYTTDRKYDVTLTVSDTAGASASTKRVATVNSPIAKIMFHGASTAAATGQKSRVVVSRAASPGDLLVLFVSEASTRARIRLPSGWTLIGRTHRQGLTSAVYDKVATRRHMPHSVAVSFSRAVPSSVVLAAYRHAAASPIERLVVKHGAATKTHVAPTLRHLVAGSMAVGYWTQTSNRATSWTAPRGLKTRAVVRGASGLRTVRCSPTAVRHAKARIGLARPGPPRRAPLLCNGRWRLLQRWPEPAATPLGGG